MYLQWNHGQHLLSDVLSKEGISYTQEQPKGVSEDITDYHKNKMRFQQKREDADE